ncbi:response regulator transcription factor [Candidatus Gracilibacteria bacterium]|nr:response regulator transcription factor [Candidatus Gracilibacteria bacterium]
MHSAISALGVKKILLIEDNRDISENIKEYLELENFTVTQAFDGETGIERATREDYDIILLDLMLPGVDGITIAKKAKQKNNTPIIMITARESIEHRLEGFESGAVDYLVKPFDLRELHARVQIHMQNSRISQNGTQEGMGEKIDLGDVVIDLKKHEFSRGGLSVHLTQKEFLIIEKLILEQDRVVTRSDIIEHLWGESSLFEGDNKLDVYISNIRKKLGKNIVKTVKGVGYTFGA